MSGTEKYVTVDMQHVKRLVGPSATCDRSNKLAANWYFKGQAKRKKGVMLPAIPETWKAHVPDYLFEVKNAFDLLKREILNLYEDDSMEADDWKDISDLEGYAAVVVNDLQQFAIELVMPPVGSGSMARLRVKFSYGGVFRTSPAIQDFHDLWRGRMPSPV